MNQRLSFHLDRPRRLPRTGVMLAAAIAGVAIGAAWRLLGPADEGAARTTLPAVPALPVATQPALPVQPAGAAAAVPAVALPPATPAPQRPAAAPLSVMVAPGVHITPMSVPAGTVPEPAGPRPHDSEPEN